MITNSLPGKLIVLEGLDGAGTTTQTRLLAEALRKHNIRVWTTREPSEGPIGAQIRAVLSRRLTMGKNTLAALFAADRLDHIYSQGGVRERLERNEWVIMDRYYLSSFAYQALSMNDEEKRWLLNMHQYCIQPDLTIFVDVQAETSMARISVNRGFHFELFETQDKLLAIRDQYLKAITGLRKQGEVIHIIPGEPILEVVRKNIWKRVEIRFVKSPFLSSLEEQNVLSRKELKEIRQDAEEKLGLTYQGTKYAPPSKNPADLSKGNTGGSLTMEFLDENGIEFHVAAFLSTNQNRITTILAQTSAKGRDKIDELKSICALAHAMAINEMRTIRQEAEKKLELTYKSAKEYFPSQKNGVGNFILTFVDKHNTEYHIFAYLNQGRTHITSVRVESNAGIAEVARALQNICNLSIGKQIGQPELLEDSNK